MVTEGLGVPSEVISDCIEFYKCLLIEELTASNCNSSMNTGSRTKSINLESEDVLNKEFSKCSSKGSSSR